MNNGPAARSWDSSWTASTICAAFLRYRRTPCGGRPPVVDFRTSGSRPRGAGMPAERWRRIESLYHSACELGAEERRAFLGSPCGSDEAPRREGESPLANHDFGEEFLETQSPESVRGEAATEIPAGTQIGPHTVVAVLPAGCAKCIRRRIGAWKALWRSRFFREVWERTGRRWTGFSTGRGVAGLECARPALCPANPCLR